MLPVLCGWKTMNEWSVLVVRSRCCKQVSERSKEPVTEQEKSKGSQSPTQHQHTM